ncbi:hypothetical protein O7626_01565 [Micromonospora sp. WMMD1102]|uniref:hypothetical protein n=1 Tax=Micromonospora sp. WMMD1102 TaxID=3016105 RepID=UPI002414F22B|nr:hypothetical protein [Micromonospora sp. WMMD1102]MDG4784634.1 hypothetical protein [Micromonospora sp. WMMD1102]
MKYLSRLAVLALPVVAAVSLGVAASAAPGTGSQLLAPASGDTGSASRSGSSVAAVPRSYISNVSAIVSIGVIKDRDGSYAKGSYDALLPVDRRTDSYLDWDHAQGFYIGPGFCADLFSWNGSTWISSGTVGSGTWWPDQTLPGQSIARWEVLAHRC